MTQLPYWKGKIEIHRSFTEKKDSIKAAEENWSFWQQQGPYKTKLWKTNTNRLKSQRTWVKVKFRGKLVGQFGNRSFAPSALEQEKNAMSESISINQIVNLVGQVQTRALVICFNLFLVNLIMFTFLCFKIPLFRFYSFFHF